MDFIAFPGQGTDHKIPVAFLFLFLSFFWKKSGLIGTRLGLVSETKTDTRRNEYGRYYCKATTPSKKVVRPFC